MEQPSGPILRADELSSAGETLELLSEAFTGKVVGQGRLQETLLIGLLTGGHILLESVPGLAKTTAASTLAHAVSGSFCRIQCTPDLLPSDIVGTQVYDASTAGFTTHLGPVHANIVLLDEINRASAKTQSAMLEAMQERNVTVDGATHPLPRPFFVIATQNPIEQAGTFPLPEAQLDRFLFKLSLGYPGRLPELDVLLSNRNSEPIEDIQPVVTRDGLVDMMRWADNVTVSEAVMLYIIDLTQTTRTDPSLSVGASPRASLALMRGARVRASSMGRDDVLPDDVKALAMAVLAHRVILTPDAQLRETTPEAVTEALIQRVKVPTSTGSAVSTPERALVAAVS